jgi:hypothetical protein
MKNLAVLGLVICFASACATSTNYSPPTRVAVNNSAKIAKPFDAVWDQLVKELSSDFFVINNIDKNSRIINISFTSNRPSEYIDCGSTSRSSSHILANGVTQYNTADSAGYRTNNSLGQLFDVNRTTRLEGRSNIYVAPDGPGTSVIVNTKYVLDIKTAVSTLDGRPAGQAAKTIDFSTKTPSLSSGTEPGCATKGVVEAKILSFVGPKT